MTKIFHLIPLISKTETLNKNFVQGFITSDKFRTNPELPVPAFDMNTDFFTIIIEIISRKIQ